MREIVLVVLGLAAALVTARVLGWRPAAVAAVLVTLAVAPWVVHQPDSIYHAGIAEAVPTTYTFTVVLLLLTWCPPRSGGLNRLPWVFLTLLWLCMSLLWDRTDEQWAGALHLSLAVIAWFVGNALAAGLDRDQASGRFLAVAALGVVGINLAASALQVVRPSSFALLTEQGGVRVEGLLGHPGDLGKVLLMITALTLPLTRSSDRTTSRIAFLAVASSAVLIGLTASRANFLGLFLMIGVWTLLRRPSVLFSGGRLVLPLTLGLVSIPFAATYIARFAADPDGGSRPELLRAGLFQISQTPWTGTGPNSYVTVVGQFDDRTAVGLPVHNTFLLAAAELGIPMAAVLFLPLVWVLVVALRARRIPGAPGDFAVAVLALAPAVLVVGLTGWGLLKAPSLPLWFFVTAFLAAQFWRARPQVDDQAARSGTRVGGVASPVGTTEPRRRSAQRSPAGVRS